MDQKDKAQHLLRLHRGADVLVVGSAWDAGSARIFEAAGARAIATSSAGVANALGFPDGEVIPCADMLTVVKRIAQTVQIPVSADMEMGYGKSVQAVVETCRGVLEAGAVGINIEDATGDAASPLVDAELQAKKLAAIRAMAKDYGVHLVINARTDGYWLKLGDEKSRFAETVCRARLYRDAGADCIFVPGTADRDTIRALVREIQWPLNILATPGCPPVAELRELGVTRLSQGSGPARAALASTRRLAEELLKQGTYASFHYGDIPYAEANALFEREN